jgi:two-component system, NtrC family, response regulator HydG
MTRAMRIFVIDDDFDLAESLADVLEARGFEVEIAHSGEEGVARFAEGAFDMVFMDVKLPGMNGVESFLAMKAMRADARVMLMTGYGVEELLQRAIENGALGVLHKPFAITDALAVMEDLKVRGTVLVADDDAAFAASLEALLSVSGYRVALAATGGEALERVVAGGIDCVILDLRLPGMSGVEVFLELERRGRSVPTVFVSGFAVEEEPALARVRAAARGVFAKPLDPARLLGVLPRPA